MPISSKNNFDFFIKTISLCFLFGILISYNLWTNARSFPTFPVIESIIAPNWLINLFKFGLIGLFLSTFVFIRQHIINILLLLILVLVFTDQTRLQPWVYFYFLVLLPFSLSKNKFFILNYLRFLFVGIYIWSGIHKLNPNFGELIFESILIDGFKITNPDTLYHLKSFALFIPITELIMGISLLFQRTRKIGIVLVIASHLFILYYLIFGLQGNWVIIPWNIFMIYAVIFLFHMQKDKLSFPIKNRVLTTILSIALLLPIGNLLGKIDQSLSFSLYDGRLKSLYEINSGSDTHYEILNDLILEGSIIDYTVWSYDELNIPFYPENRFVQKIKKQKSTSESKLILTDTPLWRRNLLGTYRTEEELKKHQQINSIDRILFKSPVYFPKYQLKE
tara:strand:+ start:61640 stop:62815 length:1176 start_codon:yes stop_codon:yes gene_type:complete